MHCSLSLLLPLASLIVPSIAQSNTFTAIAFNVAGLPSFLENNGEPGDKTTNTARIGQLLNQFNSALIHVQEDFNYHATLYANDQHPYRTATSGGVPFGSGLNTLSNFEFSELKRIKWDKCSTFDSADCLTPKGFTFMRVKLSDNVSIDAYNLHADAGETDADHAARTSNLRQVSDYIKANSNGNAVVVFGDSNSRYTRAVDNPTIFMTENNMTDAWVELVRSGTAPTPGSSTLLCNNPSNTTSCETVDKLWYRSSGAIQLRASNFRYGGNIFKSVDGHILSDHDPILIDITWQSTSQWNAGETYGSEDDGVYFNDVGALASLGTPSVMNITLRGGDRLNAISTTLSTGQTFSHGGTGGTATTLNLDAGESLTSATVCSGEKDGKTSVFYANIGTTHGRNISAGVKTGDCVDRVAHDYFAFFAFVGRAGDEVNQLGFVSGVN